MRRIATFVVLLGAVCSPALAQAASLDGRGTTPQTGVVSGTFSGAYDQSGILASWHGNLAFGGGGGGASATYTPNNGSVSWTVSGTDPGGCTYSGSGQLSIQNGHVAGNSAGGYAAFHGSDTYFLEFNTVGQGLIPGYNAFPVTLTCPNQAPVTEQYPLSDWLNVSYSTAPLKVQNNVLEQGSDGFTTGPFFSESWKWNFQGQPPSCPAPNVSTGPGYAQLSADMKARLGTLYRILDAEHACYHFTVGFRNETTQKDLYDRWHQIADSHQNDPKVCQRLKSAGFKQCPNGWNATGVAQGGPAKPGSSRHERAQAADITVTFPPTYEENVLNYRIASHRAGLCGPPVKDAVHVELPYAVGKQKTPTCHFD